MSTYETPNHEMMVVAFEDETKADEVLTTLKQLDVEANVGELKAATQTDGVGLPGRAIGVGTSRPRRRFTCRACVEAESFFLGRSAPLATTKNGFMAQG